jgi:ERCC4-type nuclease
VAGDGRGVKILIDTREQTPLDFSRYQGVEVERAGLATGDYSAAGLEDFIALERKSLPDLVACIGPERERFERELQRGKALDFFGVAVEATMEDVAAHAYRSRTSPASVMQSVLTFSIRYGTHFLWCGSRDRAAYVVHSLLSKYRREVEKRYQAATA